MNAATVAIEKVLELVAGAVTPIDAAIDVSRDAGAFDPTPVGVLVGLPSLVDRFLDGGAIFELPVLVVSSDPLNTPAAVDRVYAIADAIADVAGGTYRPATFGGRAGAEPLPAIEVSVSVTATQEV